MLPRRQRAAHAALQKTCGRRASPDRNGIFLPVGQRPRARAEGDPTLQTLETSTPKICWLVVEPYPSEYDFVSWDDDMPNIRNIWKNKIHVPNHQAV